MRLRLLGPAVIAVDGGGQRTAGSPRERVVLSMLALNANRHTALSHLVDAVWADAPPATARTQIQICVSALRRRLSAAGGWATIDTEGTGYRLVIAPNDLDLEVFAAALDTADAELGRGAVAAAADTLAEALRLWQGPAFSDVDSEVVRRAATALEERRRKAQEDRIRLDLQLGRQEELIGELRRLIAETPLRERLHGQLMLALYRSGRQSEALEAYRAAREVLVREVGVEPGRELRELERAILANDPSIDPPQPGTSPGGRVPGDGRAGPDPPRQLPAMVSDFAGRAPELEEIVRWLTRPAEPERAYAVRVVSIVGPGGVGKSTLAVRAAHELTDAYPDGQLYVHQDPRPAGEERTVSVLGRFLRALGMAEALIPHGVAERAETFRSRVAGRRMLIVLDGVDGDDVMPLLPGTPGSAVIITSRHPLVGLPGAFVVPLAPLEDTAAVDLLAGIVGRSRLDREPAAAVALAQACDGLPLALRIAGVKLSSRPQWTVAYFVSRLADIRDRLDELSYGGLELRSTLGLTYRALDERQRILFRRMAVCTVPDLPGWSAAALLDLPSRAADDALADLVSTHLVAVRGTGGAPRYGFHDLVRAYASECLDVEDEPDVRSAALRRMLGGWLTVAERARRPEYGDVADLRGAAPRWNPPGEVLAAARADPLGWLAGERQALVAAVRQAASAGFDDLCWELAMAAAVLFEIQGGFDDWRESMELAIAAADRSGDGLGSAATRYSMGALLVHQGRPDEAARWLRAALGSFEPLAHKYGRGLVLRQLSVVHQLHREPAKARAAAEQALALLHGAGDRSAEAHVRSLLARLDMDAGDLAGAAAHLDKAVRLAVDSGGIRTEAQILYRVADLAMDNGDPRGAEQAFDRVLGIATSIGDRVGMAYAWFGIGRARRAAGDEPGAVAGLQQAAGLAEQTGDRNLEIRACRVLHELTAAAGDPEAAAYQARAERAYAYLAAVSRASLAQRPAPIADR